MTSVLTLSWQNVSDALPDNAEQHDAWLEYVIGKHQHKAYTLWLDSAATEHSNSRFHVLLKEPLAYLKATRDGSELELLQDQPELSKIVKPNRQKQPFLSAADELMRQLQQRLCVQQHSQIPFNGGFAGYLSYDLGRQIERLPAKNAIEYRTPTAGLGLYLDALVFDKSSRQLWLLAPMGRHQQVLDSWLTPPSEPSSAFKLTSNWHSNMDRDHYSTCFNSVRDYLLAGDCYQINLAQRFSATYQGNEWQAYCQLRHQNAAPFSAFMRLPDSSILSVSPERFISLDARGHVETKPIKGTRPRGVDPDADLRTREALQRAPKDRAENLMIVDLLRNDLSRSCLPGTINVPHLFSVESFPAVHHLVSTVVGQLAPEKNVFDLFKGAFPGGSITGAPKVRAMQIIEELEPNRRSVYCGSIAYFSLCGASDSSITIRTLLAESGQLFCWAGGGLVIDSEDQSEYQETLDKVARILPILEAV